MKSDEYSDSLLPRLLQVQEEAYLSWEQDQAISGYNNALVQMLSDWLSRATWLVNYKTIIRIATIYSTSSGADGDSAELWLGDCG